MKSSLGFMEQIYLFEQRIKVNQMPNYEPFLSLIFGFAVIIIPLVTLFHELGHAIPAILLTKEKVTIFVGSYGNPNGNLKINLGLLCIFLCYNPFTWRSGVCIPSAKMISINRQIVYILGGPIAPLFISSVSCYFAFVFELNGSWKLFFVVFIIFACFGLIKNLTPSQTPIKLYDGTITHNDGHSLKELIFYKNLPKEFSKAAYLYEGKKYNEAALIFEELLDKNKHEKIYRLTINSYLKVKNYKKVKEISEAFLSENILSSSDYLYLGFSYSKLNLHKKALESYENSLELDPDNQYSLINKGYTLIIMNKFKEAIVLLNKAIEIEENSSFSYATRGLAKTKLGLLDQGLKDINHSIALDPSDSSGYKNLGIYHFDKDEFKEALALFEKAKFLNPETHLIDDFINDAQLKLS